MPWPAPTNLCPENKKGSKKIETTKEKRKKISYNFFDETYTFASPGIRTADLPYHYTTQALVTLWGMLFFYINSKIDL